MSKHIMKFVGKELLEQIKCFITDVKNLKYQDEPWFTEFINNLKEINP